MTAMSKPFFSVIVPSHNGQDHIRKALDSVRNQTFKDYELIVVCDSCTDDTEKIATDYDAIIVTTNAQRDGLARNDGLDVATGEWILFLDDDDWFLHEYVFQMLSEVLGQKGEDMLFFSFIWKCKGYTEQTMENQCVMAWCKCYSRTFIGDTRFNDKAFGSDVDFHHELMRKKPTIMLWNTPMYYYNYLRKGSLTEQAGVGNG